jgi:Zn-finger nucleic acid-binding protein
MFYFERDNHFYYDYLHSYANKDILFVTHENNIYSGIMTLLMQNCFCDPLLPEEISTVCVLTEKKIIKNYTTKCGHSVEEFAMVERVRSGINTCPICGEELFDISELKQLMFEYSDSLQYCDYFDDDENSDKEEDKEEFTRDFLDFWAWLN